MKEKETSKEDQKVSEEEGGKKSPKMAHGPIEEYYTILDYTPENAPPFFD